MKRKFIVYLPCVTLGLFLSSCSDKKSVEKPADEGDSASPVEEMVELVEAESANPEMDEQVEQIKEIQKQQKVAPVKEEEVRDVAGFAKHLPIETELFFNAQGIAKLISAMRGSEIGELFVEMVKKEGDDIDKMMQSEDFQEFLNIAGEDVFLSMGDGSAQTLKTMGDMYGIYYETYYYVIGKFMLNAVEGKDMVGNPRQLEEMMQKMLKPIYDELLEMENYDMPRVYAGFKVTSESDRERYTKLLQDTFAKLLDFNDEIPLVKEMFLPDSTDLHGGFKGVKIDYKKVFDALENLPEAKKEMAKMGLTGDYMKKFSDKYKDYKVTLLVGNYGDYVVIYLGDTAEGLEFIEEPSDSLLANEEMSFLKEYKGKEVISVAYVSKEITEELDKVSNLMEDLSSGLCKLLGETKSLGDTRHVQALLQKIASNGRKLDEMRSPSRLGSVAYLEDGFKMDSFHGKDSGIYDLESRRKLADIAMLKDAVISSSWVENEEISELTIQNLEDMVNLAYQTTKLVVAHDMKDAEFIEFADMFKLLDGQFSDDLATIWKATRDAMQQGYGNEGAMVMDLKGKMPNIPDTPTIILENGKIPRIAIGYDVEDREKLASSWEVIDSTNKQIVSKIERITNEKINYRQAELASKEGIDFWSYQLGVTSFDANLALGINDQMMFFTTSPSFVESFLPDYDAEGKRGGMDFKLRMQPMRDAVKDWLGLFDEHGDEISPTFDRTDFEESKVIIDKMLKASEELDSLDFSMRKINGEVRSFLHLNKHNE